MKNIFTLTLILSLLILNVTAQQEFMSQTVTTTIYTKDISKSKAILMNVVDSSKSKVIGYSEGNSSYSYAKNIKITIWTNKNGYEMIDRMLDKLGYVDSKKLTTTANGTELNSLQSEINYLKKEDIAYQTELDKMDKSNTNYSTFWSQIRANEKKIFELEKQVGEKKDQISNYTFDIILTEDIGTPQETSNQDDIQFVNMPGVEYNYLKVENPQAGLSSDVYQGGGIKYLFTRGKSFVSFGVMKSMNQITDSLTYKELFTYSVGQDFYPRHFGRGKRKFLNLYTGYTVGGMFATSDSYSRNILYATPNIGLEIFKNKYILLDSKAGYLIPIDAKTNLHLRGIIVNASFNFLF